MPRYDSGPTLGAAFFDKALREMQRARKLFPGNTAQLAALMEEVGELANALIEYERGKATAEQVMSEAIQVAAMAGRVGLEGSSEFSYQRG